MWAGDFQAFVWGRRQFQELSYESYFKLDTSALMSFVPQYNMPRFLGIGLGRDLEAMNELPCPQNQMAEQQS